MNNGCCVQTVSLCSDLFDEVLDVRSLYCGENGLKFWTERRKSINTLKMKQEKKEKDERDLH